MTTRALWREFADLPQPVGLLQQLSHKRRWLHGVRHQVCAIPCPGHRHVEETPFLRKRVHPPETGGSTSSSSGSSSTLEGNPQRPSLRLNTTSFNARTIPPAGLESATTATPSPSAPLTGREGSLGLLPGSASRTPSKGGVCRRRIGRAGQLLAQSCCQVSALFLQPVAQVPVETQSSLL